MIYISFIRFTCLALAGSLLMPYLAAAQISHRSANYEISDINFGSNNALTTSEGIPPRLTSDGPSITRITPTTVTIAWDTDKRTDATVEYGLTTAYGQTTGTSELSTSHSVTVTGLTPQTTYHYRVVSRDAFNGIGRSDDDTFTTPAETAVSEFRIENITYTEAFITVKIGGGR